MASVKKILLAAVLGALALPIFAQLTPDQRVLDFQTIASFYARYYAPTPWKAAAFNADPLNLTTWIPRVRAAKDDIEYYELVLAYVASFRDTHTTLDLPTDFRASLGITVDLFGGRVLIDSIDRRRLPIGAFPFEIGDEVVSLDGRSAESWITEFSRLTGFGNPGAVRRYAASMIPVRRQWEWPRAVTLGDAARVEIQRAGGAATTYTLPWLKIGTALSTVGPIRPFSAESAFERPLDQYRQRIAPRFRRWADLKNAGLDALAEIESERLASWGQRTPAFTLPTNFVRRRGGPESRDFSYSGVFQADGLRIGYLRIPSFLGGAASVREVRNEIIFLNANTDGLVVDVMRNPGGSCVFQDLAESFFTGSYLTTGDQYRPNLQIINAWRQEIALAELFEDPPDDIATLRTQLRQLEDAYLLGQPLTAAFPACGLSFQRDGIAQAYTKPLVVLIDEFSISAADYFAATLKAAKRGVFVGKRSNGAGGSVVDGGATSFLTETVSTVTISLGTRPEFVKTPGFPDSPFIENIGVAPDVELDIMTVENLRNGGRPFVEGFTRVIVDEIRKASPPRTNEN